MNKRWDEFTWDECVVGMNRLAFIHSYALIINSLKLNCKILTKLTAHDNKKGNELQGKKSKMIKSCHKAFEFDNHATTAKLTTSYMYKLTVLVSMILPKETKLVMQSGTSK